MMWDTDSKSYLHSYIEDESNGCGICGGKRKDHINSDDMLKESNIVNVNNVHVNIDPEVLNAFEDTNICRICFDNVITETNKILLSCGHEFCGTCVKNYLKISINNGIVKKT
jgi:hypothetical protein